MTEIISKIPARIKNAAVGGHVCGTEDIMDDVKNKTQQQINSEVEQNLGSGGSVDQRISNAKTEIIGDAALDYNTLGKIEDKLQEEVSNRALQNYTKNETYNKEELNSMITTPNQKYVTVNATSQTTAITDVLPSSGEADTIYRVGNWNGVQYDTTCYSEYSWNGNSYIPLSVKNAGVDSIPTKNSSKLMESGGIYDNMYKPLFIEDEDFDFSIEGAYIDQYGQEQSFWNGSCTDFIPTNKGDEWIFSAVNVQARVATYDLNKQFIGIISTSNNCEFLIANDNIKYIRASGPDNDANKYIIKRNNYTYNDILNSLKDIIEVIIDDFSQNSVTGKFIYNTGGVGEQHNSVYKEFDVYTGTKIKIFNIGIHNNVCVIAKKLADSTFTSLLSGSDVSNVPIEYVCNETMTIAISSYAVSVVQVKIINNISKGNNNAIKELKNYNINKEQETLIQDVDFGFMFNSIGVIGDSLSCGTIEYGSGSDWGSYLAYSWPAYLKKRWNSAIYKNYAHAGQTTANWISQVLPTFQDDEQICDIYFIALGTNNEYDESNPKGDQENYDAFVSRYNSIIDAVRTKAPHAAIMLVSLFQKRNGNAALESIAATRMATDKGIYYIDYANNAKYKRYSPEVNLKGHFSTTGYAYVASVINQVLNNVIWNNQTEDFWKEFAVYHSGQ